MNNKVKIILAVVGAVVAIITAIYGLSNSGSASSGSSMQDSISVKVTNRSSESKFEIIDYGKLRTHLIDSLKGTLKPELLTIYKAVNYNLDSLISEAKKEALARFKDSLNRPIFSSHVDSNFVEKDSAGKVKDSTHVESDFYSPIPLHQLSQHRISLQHFRFDSDTTRTITRRNIWSNIKPGLMAAYGYAIKLKTWDWFVGAGANIDVEGIIKQLTE